MITVNLLDAAFAHLTGSSVHGKVAKHIRYERGHMKWDGITLITDAMLTDSNVLNVLDSKYKIGWLLESRDYCPERYRRAVDIADRLDALLTHDQGLLDALPGNARYVPFGGCWINEANYGLWQPKSKRVSHIYSGKTFMEGHQLRHAIAAQVPGLDLYGLGTLRPVETKEEALIPYEFSVVVENCRTRGYFTEKLLDCFATGTVPIYWGAPNIGEFFDMSGIITFDSIEALKATMALPPNYELHREGIAANFERFKQYAITDDWIALNVLKEYA